VVKSILVSQDDSVEVGRVVAVVSEGVGRGKVESLAEHAVVERRETSSGSTSATAASKEDVAAAERSMERTLTPQPVPESERNVMVSANGHGRAHMPSISFPTRRTADGRMISGMSEDDQKRIRNEELSVLHSASFFLRNMEGGGGAARAPPLWRRPMTDREMESIMLGGAE
jgi:pyruvate/2-oxoglutarate dehydrogenase complex dihydrolipoamide acyltransferase (E2) component